MGDSHYLEQAFYNLLNNAVQAFVKEKDDTQNEKKRIIEVKLDKNKNFSVVQFIDNGPGYPKIILRELSSPSTFL